MLNINQHVNPNYIIIHALSDNENLPKRFRETLNRLGKFGKNSGEILKITENEEGVILKLKIVESYNSSSVPAAMCEAYNGGGGADFFFETMKQAELVFTSGEAVPFVNLSIEEIQASQLVRLIYNNKNLLIMSAGEINRIEDHHGVIGRSIGVISQYQTGLVKLLTTCQLMDNSSFMKLTVRGLRNV